MDALREKYPVEDWQYEVANGHTILGYEEWVMHCKEQDESDQHSERGYETIDLVDDTRPLGKVLADKTAEDTQKEISDSEIFTNKPESPIRKMDSDEDKKTKSMFQEMLSDEDRKAESNLILAANSVKEIVCPSRPARGLWAPGHYMNACVRCKEQFIGDKRAMECADCAYKEPNHIVVPADGEYKDSLMWVCTKCWPGTNEVLTLGRNMRIVTHCEVCGCKSENDDDLNAIWKSWIARVLRRHWEEHKA